MKKLIVFFLFFSSFNYIFGQSYDLAAGVRLGTDIGLSIQLRLPPINKNFTLETIIQSSLERDENMFTILGEQHIPIATRRINIYGGGGVHFGWPDSGLKESGYIAPAGLTLVGGGEINFKNFNLSADFKPAINLKGGEKTFYSQTALTVRFIPFKRYDIWESPREKRKKQRIKNRDSRKKNRQRSGKRNWEFWKKN